MSTGPITAASAAAVEALPLPAPASSESDGAPAAALPSADSAHAPAEEHAAEVCASCAAPLAPDQRYCLECGARRVDARSQFLDALHPRAGGSGEARSQSSTGVGGQISTGVGGFTPPPARGSLAVIAGVGVLLLAMGVGVLIGRSGADRSRGAAPAQVITVAGAGSGAAATAGGSGTTAFTGDWPAGSDGWTVQLQTLPTASTQPDAVSAAKVAASGRGATGVGALKSDDYASLTSGSYIVYSGVYTTKAQAQKALGRLKQSFTGATVIEVSSKAAAAAGTGGAGAGSSHRVPSSQAHPAPPSVLNNLRSKSDGQSYEQKSKNLPNVVSTG
ncbi:MAG TPA: hypothetical protein VLJ42_07645 [Solirubrobacteraceae bacterium]|nr:hypothetical protein [Solirubrobacteraceae bacterium]